MDQRDLEMIQANAQLAIKTMGPLSELAFGYNRESVAWVEGFIERQRTRASADQLDGMVSVIGSFIGEAIIAAAGGVWADSPHGRGVQFTENTFCFPFTKVRKQFENGVAGGDSVLGFYETTIEYVATGAIGDDTRIV